MKIGLILELDKTGGNVSNGNYERISYIDGMFEYKTDGTDEQTLAHIMDDTSRIAMIRVGDDFGDTTPAIKYNLEDHLGSSSILLRSDGTLINKEEYYPFGETSFGSYAKKRYRYSGKEKDQESGLYYYGARYYMAMACRFVSVDPSANIEPSWTPYRAFFNNPLYWTDPTGEFEFKNYESYVAHQTKNGGEILSKNEIGGQGHWLASDRENNTDVWRAANEFNLQQTDGNLQYRTMTQRAAFYGWFQRQVEAKGFETKWAGAAHIVAQQMSLMEESIIAGLTPDHIISFAKEGNKAIFDDVFSRLRTLHNGPVLKGNDALNWDNATLLHEQRDVVQPIYEKYDEQYPGTAQFLEDLAKGNGWRAFFGYSLDRRFPIGGPLKFTGNVMNWRDRIVHGMQKVVPFYNKYRSIFNWNIAGDGRIDTVYDPDNPGRNPHQKY